jgi:hypothetical protein
VTYTCTVLDKVLCFWAYILCLMKHLKGQRSRPLTLLRVCCYVPSQKENSVDISYTPVLVGLYAKLQLYIANCLRFLFPLLCQQFVLKLFISGWYVMRFTLPFWDLRIHCTSNHLGQGPMHFVALLQSEILYCKGQWCFKIDKHITEQLCCIVDFTIFRIVWDLFASTLLWMV